MKLTRPFFNISYFFVPIFCIFRTFPNIPYLWFCSKPFKNRLILIMGCNFPNTFSQDLISCHVYDMYDMMHKTIIMKPFTKVPHFICKHQQEKSEITLCLPIHMLYYVMFYVPQVKCSGLSLLCSGSVGLQRCLDPDLQTPWFEQCCTEIDLKNTTFHVVFII